MLADTESTACSYSASEIAQLADRRDSALKVIELHTPGPDGFCTRCQDKRSPCRPVSVARDALTQTGIRAREIEAALSQVVTALTALPAR